MIHVNGFYNPDVHNWTLPEKLSPYMIGPDMEGLSEQLHYSFIHNYRTKAIHDESFVDYLKHHEYSNERQTEIQQIVDFEGSTIQLEMLIYLKIWEMDAFIKRLYQAARILHGEPYDWHFKIQESNRDTTATGKRHEIIRNLVRERLTNNKPVYDSIKRAYLTQIRNSIAHSKYSFLGRNIHPNNYVSTDPASQLKNLPFDDWIEMFHETMALYNQYLRLYNRINDHYGELALKNNNRVEVKIERLDPKQQTKITNLIFRPEYKDWRWERPEDNNL